MERPESLPLEKSPETNLRHNVTENQQVCARTENIINHFDPAFLKDLFIVTESREGYFYLPCGHNSQGWARLQAAAQYSLLVKTQASSAALADRLAGSWEGSLSSPDSNHQSDSCLWMLEPQQRLIPRCHKADLSTPLWKIMILILNQEKKIKPVVCPKNRHKNPQQYLWTNWIR